MAIDIFAKIGDIKGESMDSAFKDQIEVFSWSFGVSQPGSMGSGTGGGQGKASFQDFTFVHNMDKASPNLLKACATGKHYPEASVTARKAGEGQKEYLVFKFSDVLITSVSPGGSSGSDALQEQVSMQFTKVELEYKPQKADGSLDAGVFFKYDVKANKSY
jgi:type VI secretion system secreted protein Hcp